MYTLILLFQCLSLMRFFDVKQDTFMCIVSSVIESPQKSQPKLILMENQSLEVMCVMYNTGLCKTHPRILDLMINVNALRQSKRTDKSCFNALAILIDA